jgi:hypothetical protein
MRFSAGLASGVLLASTAQACARIYVNEVKAGDLSISRDIKLWDSWAGKDLVSELNIPYQSPEVNSPDVHRWFGSGYLVRLNGENNWGNMVYPDWKAGCKFCSLVIPKLVRDLRVVRVSTSSNALVFPQRYTDFGLLLIVGYLSQQARRETPLPDGRRRREYCLWDGNECGNYRCDLP